MWLLIFLLHLSKHFWPFDIVRNFFAPSANPLHIVQVTRAVFQGKMYSQTRKKKKCSSDQGTLAALTNSSASAS